MCLSAPQRAAAEIWHPSRSMTPKKGTSMPTKMSLLLMFSHVSITLRQARNGKPCKEPTRVLNSWYWNWKERWNVRAEGSSSLHWCSTMPPPYRCRPANPPSSWDTERGTITAPRVAWRHWKHVKPHTTNLCSETDTKSTNTAINMYKNHGQPHNTNPHLPQRRRLPQYWH